MKSSTKIFRTQAHVSSRARRGIMNSSAILAGLARRLPRRGDGSLSTEAVPAEYGALPCVCAREEPKYWWARECEVSGWLLKRWPRINRELGGMSSVELCRCAHCGKTCSM